MQPGYYVFFSEHESSSTFMGYGTVVFISTWKIVLLFMIYMTGWPWLFCLGAFGQCFFLDMNDIATFEVVQLELGT
jgi:hypothetical protein